MPTIVQSVAGDPTAIFFAGYFSSDSIVAESSTSFYWAKEGMSGDTPVWSGGVVVEGVGLAYVGETLTVANKVTTLKAIDSLYPSGYVPEGPGRVTFSNLSLSAADTMALLNGNTTRLANIIAANPWNYTGSGGDDTFTSSDFADSLNGGGGADKLYGKAGDDIIQGGTGVDLIYGGDGKDKIDGGPGGTDLMYGGRGDDRYFVDNNSDRVRESAGEGNDAVYATDDFFLFGTAEVELLSVRDRNLVATTNLRGNNFSQTIVGGAGANRLDGQGGSDVLEGGLGADRLVGGTGADTATYARASSGVTVSLANPTINGGEASGDTFDSIERLIGSAYNDSLNGSNEVNNTIRGGAGYDTLKGYTGNDVLEGGAGKDIFVFNTALSAATNVDTILDFNPAADTIQIDNYVFTTLSTVGVLAASAFKDVAVAAKDASDRILYNSDTGNLYYDRDGSGGTYAAIKFAALTGSPTLTAADFVVI
ncbi:calcium-binding protein [Mesorhizobium sp. IMUNJ 23232]|uniref:calcium-binding protein n=1 Tax=Mesorhizobium sp. IMUNJ 23232 TaxID=3376064 RepID=UPI0037BCE197